MTWTDCPLRDTGMCDPCSAKTMTCGCGASFCNRHCREHMRTCTTGAQVVNAVIRKWLTITAPAARRVRDCTFAHGRTLSSVCARCGEGWSIHLEARLCPATWDQLVEGGAVPALTDETPRTWKEREDRVAWCLTNLTPGEKAKLARMVLLDHGVGGDHTRRTLQRVEREEEKKCPKT